MKALKWSLSLVAVLLVAYFGLAAYNAGALNQGVLAPPSQGSPASRAAEYLNDPEITNSSIPNVVILAVIAAESGGNPTGGQWYCAIGPTLPKPCKDVYPLDLIPTVSVNVGLMGVPNGPWNPEANITAGVTRLQKDLSKYHYLEYALEAYDGAMVVGPKAPAAARAFAQEVLNDIHGFEEGPVTATWTKLPLGQAFGSIPGAPLPVTWYQIDASDESYTVWATAIAPFGEAESLRWVRPVTLSLRDLVAAKSVMVATTLNGRFQVIQTMAPVGKADLWTVAQTGQGLISVAAQWNGSPVWVGSLYMNPPSTP